MVKVFLSPKEKGERVSNALFLSGRTATEVNQALGQSNAYMTRVTLARRQSTTDEEYYRIAEQLAGRGRLEDKTVDEVYDYFVNADVEWDIQVVPRLAAWGSAADRIKPIGSPLSSGGYLTLARAYNSHKPSEQSEAA